MKLAALSLLGCVGLGAQVALNSASGASTVAPGSLVSIYGSNLPVTTGSATSLPLPIDAGYQGIALAIYPHPGGATTADYSSFLYWSPTQINIVLPNVAAAGDELVGEVGGEFTGLQISLNILSQAPGIFLNPVGDCSITAAGCAQRLVRGIITDINYMPIASANPARPGQPLVVWCTGLGVTPTWPQVSLLPSSGPAAIGFVSYTGHTSFPGLDQLNFIMPGGNALSSGCTVGAHIEVQLSMQSLTTGFQANTVPLPVITDTCN